MFSSLSKKSLIKATLFKNTPIYVQFYITARCNLTCEQCNIIYSNADVEECSIYQIEKIAENFAKLGVAIVLLTGGEPFLRKDLPQIINAFESRGIHIRMQTNGFASEKQIDDAIKAGGKDISISLDSLKPSLQDKINGGFKDSWHQAIKAISLFTNKLPKENSFASLGTVLQKKNHKDIIDIIKFGTSIGWYTSLVPVHTTTYSKPMGFRTFDNTINFVKDQEADFEKIIHKVKSMKREGFLLYDSDQYLNDIYNFVLNKPIEWREKNKNICDSPNLYFAVLPNGEFAPCCDHRLNSKRFFTYSDSFVKDYNSSQLRNAVYEKTSSCSGCMYGSYPEITISMRYLKTTLERISTFFSSPPKKEWPYSYEYLIEKAKEIATDG